MTIDILLPSYCQLPWLQSAVRSVQRQDDPDWKLTVVDDGFPDERIARWFDDLGDDRVMYRRNSERLGLPGNYQRCLTYIDHEIVTLMGADDVMLPNYVTIIRRLSADYPQAAIFQPGVEVVDTNGRPHSSLADAVKHFLAPRGHGPLLFSGEQLAVSILRGNWLYFPSLAFRAGALQQVGFRHSVSSVHDLALIIDLVLEGHGILVDPTVCFQYRRHRGSDSSGRARTGSRFADERDYFRTAAAQLDAHGWPRAAAAARTHLSSRLHALAQLPHAVRERRAITARRLVHHAIATTKAPRPSRTVRPESKQR